MAVWAVFLILTALHIYANVRAVRALQLTSLNCSRMDGLAEALLSLQGKFLPTSVENLWRTLQSVLNHTSAVLPAHTHQRVFYPVKAGCACLK